MGSVQIIDISVFRYIPEIVAWGIGVVLAVFMLRRGGGKAEKLLLVGCGLVFFTRLAVPLLRGLVRWIGAERGLSNVEIAGIMGLAINLPFTILSIAGFVCLVIAFRMRFRTGKQEPA